MGLTIKEIDNAKLMGKPYTSYLTAAGWFTTHRTIRRKTLWRWRYRFDGKEHI
jgi:hypothetical protein